VHSGDSKQVQSASASIPTSENTQVTTQCLSVLFNPPCRIDVAAFEPFPLNCLALLGPPAPAALSPPAHECAAQARAPEASPGPAGRVAHDPSRGSVTIMFLPNGTSVPSQGPLHLQRGPVPHPDQPVTQPPAHDAPAVSTHRYCRLACCEPPLASACVLCPVHPPARACRAAVPAPWHQDTLGPSPAQEMLSRP
jgi:hypothetical protein